MAFERGIDVRFIARERAQAILLGLD